MYKKFIFLILLFFIISCNPKLANGLRKNDLKKDVEMITDDGTMVIRLSDSTPLHRDNFLKLVNKHFYDGILFHRVIQNFMIQAGNPATKPSAKTQKPAKSIAGYTIPAEFVSSLFHQKGAIAAAREGDDANPDKASSGTQFYIVQGKIFSDQGLDSVQTFRLQGRNLPLPQREIYKTVGGTPHLDMNYTIFGRVISGQDVIDKIAAEPTSGRQGGDKPVKEIRILKASLIKRK
ncbi:MAG: peptidylprolyl isomerase [Chitinophagaceae bacterium]